MVESTLEDLRKDVNTMKKKSCMIIAAVMLCVLCLGGCGKKLDGTQTVAVMDQTHVPLGEVNLMLRYQQAQMETYYSSFMGNNVYQQDLSGTGVPYGETAKAALMDSFQQLYILEAEAANYGVSLSEEEKSAIMAAAQQFLADNKNTKVQTALTMSQGTVEHLLTLLTLEHKMQAALTADVDTNVSDEEAAQKRVTYLYMSKETDNVDADGNPVPMTEEELKALKEKAQGILDEAKSSKDLSAAATAQELTTNSQTYGADSAAFPDEVKAQADKLAEGEYTPVVETDQALYIVQMDSLLDRDATDAKKESIVRQRRDTLFAEKYEELKALHTFETKEDVLAQMTFGQQITLKVGE